MVRSLKVSSNATHNAIVGLSRVMNEVAAHAPTALTKRRMNILKVA